MLPGGVSAAVWRDVAPAYHAARGQELLSVRAVQAHLKGLSLMQSPMQSPEGEAGAEPEAPPEAEEEAPELGEPCSSLGTAVEYVVDRATPQDWQARCAALGQVLASGEAATALQAGCDAMQHLFGSPGAGHAMRAAQELGAALGLAAPLVQAQPLELRCNQALWEHCRAMAVTHGQEGAWAAFETRLELVRLQREWRMEVWREEASAQGAARMDIAQMSLLQQSAMVAVKKLDPELARNPIVPHLTPFLSAWDALFNSAWLLPGSEGGAQGQCQLEALEAALRQRIAFAAALMDVENLDRPRLLVHWRWLVKAHKAACAAGLALSPGFEVSAEQVSGAIGYEQTPRKNWLWKLCGHSAMPRTLRHWEVEAALLKVATAMEPDLEAILEGPARFAPALVADLTLKRELVDALGTLLCVRGDEEEAGALLSAMEVLAAQLGPRLQALVDSATAEAPALLPGEERHILEARPLWPLQDHRSLCQEAAMLAQLAGAAAFPQLMQPSSAAEINAFVEDALAQASRTPLELAPYRKLSWVVSAGKAAGEQEAGVLQKALHCFLHRVWSVSFNVRCTQGPRGKAVDDTAPNPSGPPMLACAGWLPYEEAALGGFEMSLGHKEERLKDLRSLALLLSRRPAPSSPGSELALGCHLLALAVAAHGRTFAPAEKERLMGALHRGSQGLGAATEDLPAAEAFTEAVGLVETSTDTHFKEHARTTLVPALQLLAAGCASACPRNTLQAPAKRGELLSLLGLFQLHLLEPASVVDPCDKAALKRSLLQAQISAMEEALASRRLIAEHNGDDRHHIQGLEASVRRLRAQEGALAAKICVRPSPPQFEALCSEVARLTVDLGSVERTTHTVKLSQDPANTGGEEAVWQRSAEQATRSLLRRFPMYRDLLEPLSTALYLVKHGLRLIRHDAATAPLRTHASHALAQAMVRTVQYPQGASAELSRIREVEAVAEACSACGPSLTPDIATNLLLALVARLSSTCHAAGALSSAALKVLDEVGQVFVGAWGRAEDERIRKQEEADQLYKYKGDTVTLHGEEDAEEDRILAELFPSYNGSFEDLKAEEDRPLEEEVKEEKAAHRIEVLGVPDAMPDPGH